MRKIILNLAVTLDGYIAGPNGEYDWCFTDADYGMTEFMTSVDSTLMGRKSYDLVCAYGAPYPELTNYVFSRTEKTPAFPNVKMVNQPVADFVRELKLAPGKDIWLFGGAEIIQPLIENNLVDRMLLSIHPILLGSGLPLFKPVSAQRRLHLADAKTYSSGLVQLTYEIQRD